VTLDFCFRQAEKTYPLSRQMEMLGKSNELRVTNLNKNYLPQVNLNGSASLQSDVTKISLNLPAQFSSIKFPDVSKDMYKVTLDVNQSIYDGNVTRYQKMLESYNLQSDQKSVQIELYKLKDRINQVYFSIFFLQQTEALLNSTKKQLESKLKEVHSAVMNGILLASNEDGLNAELMKIDQQLIETMTDRNTAFRILSELTSTSIPETSKLALPEVRISSMTFEDKRLESQLYDVMQSKAGVMKNMVTTRWNPKFYAFGQAGYGRPGFNMLTNDFTPFWILGARLTWNIWNWNLNTNEKKIYDIQADIINSQKETFDKNLRIEADKGFAEIEKLGKLLQKDEEIIALRVKITQSASSQLSNGVVTSSDYISRLNEETQARLALETHRIQLVKARLSYLFTQGKL
jgi:outer membrane protein TolC